MPRDLPRHAFCAPPGVATSHKTLDGLLGVLVRGWIGGPLSAAGTAIASFIVGILAPMLLLGPCVGIAPGITSIVALLQEAKRWYYQRRLLCVRDEDNCAVGSVLHKSEPSTDGDHKLDLLLAPFTEAECVHTLAVHLNANAGRLTADASFDDPPFFNGTSPVSSFTPFAADIVDDPNASADAKRAERRKLADLMRLIKGRDPGDGDATANLYNNLLVGWMDRLLDPSNQTNGEPKNFQGRYYRKDPALLDPASALWSAIPTDHDPAVPWQTPDGSLSPLTYENPYEIEHNPRGINPMFRFDLAGEPKPGERDSSRLLPFLHCELDGNAIALLMDELSSAVVAFGIAWAALCATVLPALSAGLAALGLILGGPIGAVIGLILAWLITTLLAGAVGGAVFGAHWAINGGPGRGNAEPPDVDFDDPDNFGEDAPTLDGDLVALHGPWIMDTEHAQYFEIHPVTAYYVLGRNGRGEIERFDSSSDREQAPAERLHNGVVTRAMVDEICGNVRPAEEDDPPPVVERRASEVLSYGLTTLYGGGGFAEAPR